MKLIADLHIHSYYSRATSKDLTIPHLAIWAQRKGIHVVATGDIAHPGWVKEVEEVLEPAEEGLYRLKPEVAQAVTSRVPAACQGTVRFILGGEISNIYKKKGRVRKIHNMVYFPTFEAVRRFQAVLERIGNIHADGRPILGLDARDLLEIVLDVDPGGFLIPAHIWTPWFSLLGSRSGFDSVEECFEDLTPHIFALETGLSSDPPMNWRVSALDRYTLVSASDAHSPQKLGREATLFHTELSYFALLEAMRTGDPQTFGGTVEFFPEEGKYHLDGHRKCGVVWEPHTTRAHQGICPVCGKPVTVGVMHRVEELADRPEGARKPNAHPFYSLIPLPEILSELLNVGPNSRRVQQEYERLLATLGPELRILMDVPLDAIAQVGGERLAEGIGRMRRGEVVRQPGFDGQYGVIRLFATPPNLSEAPTLFEWSEQPSTETASETLSAGQASRPSTADTVDTHDPSGTDTSWLNALNPEQRAAVETVDRPLVIVAGPGTGKTLTLTTRIAYLVESRGVPPEHILAITFTNKAAGEMRERLVRLLGEARAHQVTVATFHALATHLLRRWGEAIGIPPDFVILDDDARRQLLKTVQPALSGARLNAALDALSRWKHRVDPGVGEPPFPPELAPWERVIRAYEAARQAAHALDFDDLVREAVRLLASVPEVRKAVHRQYRWIAVDEYQDVNEVQYRLLRWLAAGGANVCVIGDPDQAIYGFRGADRQYFLRFTEDFPTAREIRLTRNYRSTQVLLDAAWHVIHRGVDTYGTPLIARWATGRKVHIQEAPTEKAEAEYVVHTIEQLVGGLSYFSIDSGRVDDTQVPRRSFGDIAVLYRLRALARPLVEAFKRAGIPFQTVGETPPTARPVVRDALAHLWLWVAPRAQWPLMQVLKAWGLDSSAVQEALLNREGEALEWRALPAQVHLSPGQVRRVDALAALWERLNTTDLSVVERCRYVWDALTAHQEITPADEEAWQYVVRVAEGFGNRVLDFLEQVTLQSETDFYNPRADRVALMTLHAAKGLEFPVVFIVGCEEGIIPYLREDDAADVEEERRLFYVGMTRAKEVLFLTHARRRLLYGERRQQHPSRFLDDIEAALKELHVWQSARRRRPRQDSVQAEQLSLWGEDGP